MNFSKRTTNSAFLYVCFIISYGVLAMPVKETYHGANNNDDGDAYSLENDSNYDDRNLAANTDSFSYYDNSEYDEEYTDVEDLSPDTVTNSHYQCPNGGPSITVDLLCDGFHDCIDKSDENSNICQIYGKTIVPPTEETIVKPNTVKPEEIDYSDYYYDVCGADEFQCTLTPGVCLPKISVCDGRSDCPDGEDENDCEEEIQHITTQPTTSPSSDKQTTVTHVIANTTSVAKNNTVTQLKISTSVAMNATHSTVAQPTTQSTGKSTSASTTTSELSWDLDLSTCDENTEFQCRTSPGDCVPRELLCDGYEDCDDGSDEIECGCASHEYQCVSGLCISATYRCDGFNDCGDFSDEMIGCPFLPDIVAQRPKPEGQINPTQTVTIETVPSLLDSSTNHIITDHALPEAKSCKVNICENSGRCLLDKEREFICVCPMEYSGLYCEIRNGCPIGTSCSDDAGNTANTLNTSPIHMYMLTVVLITFINIFFL
ncbi:unnamed protein product [Clavelina lepadiformis]|uniref:EGF-like domain-containing protein n=1 Tax=Clavelina lepadiformis TaxID=159417 RepID=A0ABP0GX20_CLALP